MCVCVFYIHCSCNNFTGCGSLIGGLIISLTGSTALAFRYFGVISAIAALLYFLYEFGYVKVYRNMKQDRDAKSMDDSGKANSSNTSKDEACESFITPKHKKLDSKNENGNM